MRDDADIDRLSHADIPLLAQDARDQRRIYEQICESKRAKREESR